MSHPVYTRSRITYDGAQVLVSKMRYEHAAWYVQCKDWDRLSLTRDTDVCLRMSVLRRVGRDLATAWSLVY